MNDKCAACGMPMPKDGPARYHPHLACLAFRACHNSATIDANLKAVIEYGMRAQRLGVSAEEAMATILLEANKEVGRE